ncbi:MAG: hypothetical protein OXC26_06735 [Albidovulum sp.]|nr:hypothetical protein [Albidovulum sp.]
MPGEELVRLLHEDSLCGFADLGPVRIGKFWYVRELDDTRLLREKTAVRLSGRPHGSRTARTRQS